MCCSREEGRRARVVAGHAEWDGELPDAPPENILGRTKLQRSIKKPVSGRPVLPGGVEKNGRRRCTG
jgi:hypothetical protein